jgi:hypothetical protein
VMLLLRLQSSLLLQDVHVHVDAPMARPAA